MRFALLPFVALLWAAFAVAVDDGFFTEGWSEVVSERGGNLFLHNDKEKLWGYLTVFYTTDIRYTQGLKELHIPLDFWNDNGKFMTDPFIKLTADSGFTIDTTLMPDKIYIRSSDDSPFFAQIVQTDGETQGDVTFHEPVVLENMKNNEDRAYIHVHITGVPPVEKTTSTTSTSTSSSSTTSTSTTPMVTPTVTGDITVSADGGTLSYAGETVAVGLAPEVLQDGAKVTIRGDNEIFVVSGSDLSSSPDCSLFKVTGSDGKVLLLKLTRDQHPLWVLGSVEVRWRLDSCTPVSTASLTLVSSESSLPTGTVGDVVKVDVWGEITNAIPWESLEDIQYTVEVDFEPSCLESSSSSSSSSSSTLSTSTTSDETSTKTDKITTETRSTTSTMTLTGDGFTFSLPIPPPVGGVIPVIPVPIPICPPLCPFPDPNDEDKTITPTEATTTDENGHSITFVLLRLTSTEAQLVVTTTDEDGDTHVTTLKPTDDEIDTDENGNTSTSSTSDGFFGDVLEESSQAHSLNDVLGTESGETSLGQEATSTDTYVDLTKSTEGHSETALDNSSVKGNHTEAGDYTTVETSIETYENQDVSMGESTSSGGSDEFSFTTLTLNTDGSSGTIEYSEDNSDATTEGQSTEDSNYTPLQTMVLDSSSIDYPSTMKLTSVMTSLESNLSEPSERFESSAWTGGGGNHSGQSYTVYTTSSVDEFGGVIKYVTTVWIDPASETKAELSSSPYNIVDKSSAASAPLSVSDSLLLHLDESGCSTAIVTTVVTPTVTVTEPIPSRINGQGAHADLSKRAVQRMVGSQGQMPSNPLGYCYNNAECESFLQNHMVHGNSLWDNSPIPLMIDGSGDQVAVFIVNREGEAPGNACNTLRWFATMFSGGLPVAYGNGRDYVMFEVSDPSEQQVRREIFGGKSCAKFGLPNHHIDEFPFNRINGDQYKFAISLMCIPGAENTSEGGNLGSFCSKDGSYTHFLPDDPDSEERPRDRLLDAYNCQKRAENRRNGVSLNKDTIKQNSNGENMVVLVNADGLDCSQFTHVGSNLLL